jgi:pimeloyl-ACP methyl ester carboxylesterase
MTETTPETRFLEIQPQRHLAYCEYGDPHGRPVFFFHGTPGSRLEPALGDQAGTKHGFRIIALDRPGMGASAHYPGRKLLDWPRDVRAAASQLEIDRFGVMGFSGGGAYALACGYELAQLVDFVVLLGSWAPVAEEPSLWGQMAPLDQFFGRLSGAAPLAFSLPFSLLGLAAKWLSPRGFVTTLNSSLSEPDRDLLDDQSTARFFAGDIREAFAQGSRGPADDANILYQSWGFPVQEVSTPVSLYHGTVDTFAPFPFALYLNDQLPGSQLHAFPGQGHLFVIKRFDRIFQDLAGA